MLTYQLLKIFHIPVLTFSVADADFKMYSPARKNSLLNDRRIVSMANNTLPFKVLWVIVLATVLQSCSTLERKESKLAGCLADQTLSDRVDSPVYITSADCTTAHAAGGTCDNRGSIPSSYASYQNSCANTHVLGRVCSATYTEDPAATSAAGPCFAIPDQNPTDVDTDPNADYKFICYIEGKGTCAVP